MPQRLSFQDEITRNKIKSALLMGIIVVFFVILGFIVSQFYDPSIFFTIMIVSIIISLLYILISYYNSDKIALASVNAKPASMERYRMLHNAVESMATASGLPKPR